MGNNYKVYIHIFPNNKVYIGITRNRTDIRWANGKGYKSQKVMSNAINKYGWKNIEHKVLYENLTKEEAEQKEIELIAFYKSNQRKYGYNIENGGNCVGKMSEETKKKISKSNIGKNTGIKNGMYGKHPKGEFKKGNIPHNKGKKTSEEERRKRSKPVLCVETGIVYYSAREANKQIGISYKSISSVCNKKRKTTGGYHWEFVKEDKNG